MVSPRVVAFVGSPPFLDENSQPTYGGARKVGAELFFHIALRSTAGQIIIACRSDSIDLQQTRVERHFPRDRVRVVSYAQLRKLELGSDEVVVQELSPFMTYSLHLRAICGRHWPVIGVTHDLSVPELHCDLTVARCAGLGTRDAIACCSRASRSVMERLFQHADVLARSRQRIPHLPIIPHGIDIQNFKFPGRAFARLKLNISESPFVFLYFGRLSEDSKADLQVLLRAFSRVTKRADAFLIFAGGVAGTEDTRFVSLLRGDMETLGIAGSCAVFVNPSEQEKTWIYSTADAFVSPANSLQESFGITLLEAMAYALPVIASDWNGYRDIVKSGSTGHLVPTQMSDLKIVSNEAPLGGDGHRRRSLVSEIQISEVDLFQFMLALAENIEHARTMGLRGKSEVAKYDWSKIVPMYESLWGDLLQQYAGHAEQHSPFVDFGYIFKDHPGGGGGTP
jgi:glycosyltransferase involved in cell wall biosynthesis